MSELSRTSYREAIPSVRQGLTEVLRGSPQLCELIQLQFIRGAEDWETEDTSTSTFQERFQDRLTGGDVVAMIQEAAYRLLPHLQQSQQNYDRNIISPSLLDDDGNTIAGLVMAFDKLAPDNIGEPRWLCVIGAANEQTQIYGVLFTSEEYVEPLNDNNRIMHVTGLRLFYPGTSRALESLQNAADLDEDRDARDASVRSQHRDTRLVIKRHTNEGEQLYMILGYLDKLVEEYLPPSPTS